MVGLRLPEGFTATIDRWAAENGVTRSEAIRRLVELGLASAQPARPRGNKATTKASDMAGQAIDRMGDRSATDEQRASRKQRLLKGPKEFRDMRGDLPKPKK